MIVENLIKEVTYKTVPSGGPGGQHANRTETKVQLYFNLNNSVALNDEEKNLLNFNLKNRLTSEGVLMLASSDTRSQSKNKEIVTRRFINLIQGNLKPPAVRKKTRKPRAAEKKRKENKRRQSEKKQSRKRVDY